jgi:hypothetical protein
MGLYLHCPLLYQVQKVDSGDTAPSCKAIGEVRQALRSGDANPAGLQSKDSKDITGLMNGYA